MRELLLHILGDAFERKAWHGTNLRGALRGLTSNEAMWRPEPERHSIWELVVHCAYWKYVVRRRLTGEKRGAFSRKGSNWFPVGGDWEGDLRLLREEHRKLCKAVEHAPARELDSLQRLIYGVAAHDVYHTGQIQLIKKLSE